MKIEYRTIREAYDFVCAGLLASHKALLDTESGEVLLQSGESDDLPADPDEERYVAIPGRVELRLGKQLVLSFVKEHAPGSLAEVYPMFCHRGAYARFREFLERNRLLERWGEYEREETERALRRWSREKGIDLAG